MRLLLCSDIDGTIIDSRELVTNAYKQVGVTMPDHAWGSPWRSWLPVIFDNNLDIAAQVHLQKNRIYRDMLHTTDIRQYALPAAQFIREVMIKYGSSCVTYLTACSRRNAQIITDQLRISGVIHAELTYERRANLLSCTPHGTIYLDDNLDTISKLTVDEPHIRSVAIVGQSFEDLAYEIGRINVIRA